MVFPADVRTQQFNRFSIRGSLTIRGLAPLLSVFFLLFCVCTESARCADGPSPPSQKAIIQEVVRVANQYIDHGPCEPSHAEPSTVATMSPYTSEVKADRAAAMYVVVWSGDIGCRNGSGTNTMNYLLLQKRGLAAARIVGVGELYSASVERFVAAAPDSLTIEVYTWGPDDARCCATVYERWSFNLESSAATGEYSLKFVDSKPAEPIPLRPGEKKLPTAKLSY